MSDSTASLGAPNGSVYKQVYTWNADQLIAQHTCHRNGGTVVADSFGYDRSLRLINTSTNANPAVPVDSYTYDVRGNRTYLAATNPLCYVPTDSAKGAAWQVDLLASKKWGPEFGACNSAAGSYNYAYDKDGRQTTMADGKGLYSVTTGYAQANPFAGYDTVFQSAVVNGGGSTGGTYSYFYDALNRRRAKTTPWGSVDEYFYDLGHQMLSDRGTDKIGLSSDAYPEDDYIWLGGRPVVIIRSKFNTNWTRQAEGTGFCARNDVQNACSANFPITDYIGKPVLMLATNTSIIGGTAGSARYQAFGAVNRQEARAATPHLSASAATTVMTINDNVPPGFDGWARVLFNYINYSSATVTFNGVVQSFAGGAKAHVWSPREYRTSTGWPLVWTSASALNYGFDVEACEVKLKQVGVHEFWTPLPLPGQYFDQETELHENWNRYYDPSTGRYLQPEPMLQEPDFARLNAMEGHASPTYAYARNNPVHFTDPDGLQVDSMSAGGLTFGAGGEVITAAEAAAAAAAAGAGAAAGHFDTNPPSPTKTNATTQAECDPKPVPSRKPDCALLLSSCLAAGATKYVGRPVRGALWKSYCFGLWAVCAGKPGSHP